VPAKISVGDYPLTKVFLFVCVAIYLAALLDSGWQMSGGLLGIGSIQP
jgi:hypothetical protein